MTVARSSGKRLVDERVINGALKDQSLESRIKEG